MARRKLLESVSPSDWVDVAKAWFLALLAVFYAVLLLSSGVALLLVYSITKSGGLP